MITVKSLGSKNSLPFKNSGFHISKMVDSELQCNIGQFSYSSHFSHASSPLQNTKNRLPQIFKPGKVLGQIMESSLSKIGEKRMYFQVQIKNVNEDEQKLIKALQMILLSKKLDQSSMKALKNQFLLLNKSAKEGGGENKVNYEKIRIPLEKMFRLYLDFYCQQVRQATLKGKSNNSIIRPFLTLFSKIKQDSSQICLKCLGQNKNGQVIQCLQLTKLFEMYEPKALLRNELAQNEKQKKSLYQEMYLKYQNVPFFQEKQNIYLNHQQLDKCMQDYQKSEQKSENKQVQADMLMKINDQSSLEKSRYKNHDRQIVQTEEIGKGKKFAQNSNESLKKKLKILSSDAFFLKSILN